MLSLPKFPRRQIEQHRSGVRQVCLAQISACRCCSTSNLALAPCPGEGSAMAEQAPRASSGIAA